MSSKPQPTTKKFGKSSRTVPHHSEKASKYYPAIDEDKPKKVREKKTSYLVYPD
jgi:large subunit ribosomal protein L6e